MVSPIERQLLAFVRNFGPHLFDPRTGISAEAFLSAWRGVALPAGKLAEQALDARQAAAVARARRDLSALVGRDWARLDADTRRTSLEAACGADVHEGP